MTCKGPKKLSELLELNQRPFDNYGVKRVKPLQSKALPIELSPDKYTSGVFFILVLQNIFI